ncbi:hypothetical protein DCO58_12185 [Helicobacter saguini]|uniref:Uncharacterized protein n=1 Tax=Helicobacter saguini TaxID=1548018 RepID=A0A347VQG4_9HELI|nr:hypothetical protein [Helicobacter saguini]MWV60952.1 hypothetical protein [Helicobacter saguini]MWV68380.1 hypothetical protein [Helicobacter saguini]MWV70156.1 hypothetical protein [Helicobacter saguini]MWV72059.1 hypothetical protein [Helicobacter saguini]TLD93717.1 hypothetical protein LS64_007960 [Helicobacter saguini]
MPQLFGSAILAFVANGVLWYYLLGKLPLALLLSHGIKFLVSYVLAFFVMAWLYHSIELARQRGVSFLDSIINGMKLPFLHALTMSIIVVCVYIAFLFWSKDWVYNVKLLAIIVVVGGGIYFWAYANLSVLYEDDLEQNYPLHKFIGLAVYYFVASIFLTLPFKILKGIFYDFPRATYRRKVELILLVGIIGGAIFAVDYLMMKGKLWKTSVEYASDVFEDEDDKKGGKKK